MKSKIPFILYFLFCAIYIAAIPARPYPLSFAVKTIPIVILLVIAFVGVKSVKGRLITTALLFSAIGDIILELRFDMSFMLGLGAFFIAQVFYLIVFARKPRHSYIRVVGISFLVLFGIMMGDMLRLRLDALLIPVMIYLVVIFAMGVAAILGGENHPLSMLGAVCFIISDAILAINRFVAEITGASFYLMTTYYLAQFLILYGFVRIDKKQRS